ncbi:ATP-dependent RNA helicase HrpA [Dechloromonas denitrificans]|uniref:ATP-dependent RNA helicase HrpA n=1 Tax=Dechloromonas denitrificans TaxID=281362 RepID=UPI001CF8FFD6|nr:ATP-dependent RNA helicase HrpA [Dechloromonas denitrificans]UCV13289.1 ATP-dependent RNA helicase HrpA [Dechloromonas denitrificans]
MQRNMLRSMGEKREKLQADFAALLEKSRATLLKRQAALPKPEFQADLPVNERRSEIAELIKQHQVVIVCGETGSGKTTQLPKICLELGRGAAGLIGHTQPRRLAARSVATRLAQELKTQVGTGVGVKIRFQDRSTAESWVKLMTDGILLAESQSDPYLSAYDTIIIDEAHERSLNIDFLLGYLKQLLPKRPDLKVIITSATIDAERFSQHFSGAPVIEVSGRLFPVDIRYRPISDLEKEDDERDLYEAITDAVDELARLGPGDTLVFLPGEREIREAAEALRKRHPPHTEILPLFSRLSAGDQDRIFKPSGARRIVLATNVAETSLTVPGIRYVVDSGLARVKRYSYRNKVEQLQIERISQAAARQRAGRCGRVAAGVCIRLYDELDFNARPPFTDPEILRSSLAGVILRMKSLKLTEVENFPFIEPPPPKAIADGYALLQELGALDDENRLTKVGDALARLPLDPRIGRMLVAARDLGCLKEVMVIAAGLSAQDPRERPQERQQAADEKHKLFADEKSEFLGWWKLWNWFQNAVEHKKSNKQLIDNCHAHFLSYLRMREWREVHGQLHAMIGELGWKENEIPGTFEAIHQALLAGLLGNLGCKSDESGYYLGARGIRYLIHPSSPLQKKAGKWIMAAEITETTKLFGRCVARIEPDWLERVGAHLIKRSYFDPHWEKKSMQVSAWERTTLYGVVINPKRRVHYGPMAPSEGREIFIRQGLVGEEIDDAFAKRWPFFQHNQKLIREIEHLEHKQRRQDVLVDDELIYAFYDHLLPEGIHNGATFDHWRKEAERDNPKLLFLAKDDLMRHSAAGVTTEAFPHHLKVGGAEYALTYHFEPGSPRDGVTLALPLAQLNQIPVLRMEWLVPGLLKEKLVQLIKTLPQRIRAKLVPVPEFVEEFMSTVANDDRKMNQGLIAPLIDYILTARGLNARGWAVTPDAFRPDALPLHFSMNYKLLDEHGRQLDMGRSLVQLRADWGREAKQEFAELHETPSEYTKLTDWTFGELPELMEVPVAGQTVLGYPGLTDDGETVSLKVFDSAEEAAEAHRAGLLRLFMLQFREQVKYFDKNVPGLTQMGMQYMALGTTEELKRQIVDQTFERACLSEPLPADAAAFKARCAEAKARLGLIMQEVCRMVGAVLTEWQAVSKKLPAFKAHAAATQDIDAQLKRLLGKRFIIETPFERLQHYPRYLKGIQVRLDKLKADPARDARLMAEYAPLWTNYERRFLQLAKQGTSDPQIEQFRWLMEELRISLFAQELRTPVPVSTKRLQKQWEGIQHG